jgi:alkylation response protein AidB-like acyl-CoA dehydrogenase
MAPLPASTILSEAMLQRFSERAPGYDRENRFFQEDFDDLRRVGYLAIAVPRQLGGRGLSFARSACGSSVGSRTTPTPPHWR